MTQRLKIAIFDYGMGFDLQTPNTKPLGGSETSVLLLAKGLSVLGHSVVLLNTLNTGSEQDGTLIRGHISNFLDVANQADVLIFNRNIPREVVPFIGKKKIMLWSHDAYDQPNVQSFMDKNCWNIVDTLLCVSQWQADTFIKYLNVPANKIQILPNPIDTSIYLGCAKRNLNQMIYSSIPYKGLDQLSKIMDSISIRLLKDDLVLKTFSSMNLYNQTEANKEYESVYDQLSKTKGIEINDVVSSKELAFHLSQSNVYIHPSTYHETFGRVFIESLASGCLPITVDNGANSEVLKDYGIIISGKNIKNVNVYNEFIDKLESVLTTPENTLYQKRLAGQDYAISSYDHIKIAAKLISYI